MTGFNSQQSRNSSLLHGIQTGPEMHPAYYAMGIVVGALFVGVKLITHLDPVAK
jgi:hypothetical protein